MSPWFLEIILNIYHRHPDRNRGQKLTVQSTDFHRISMRLHRLCMSLSRPEPTSLSVQIVFYLKRQKNSIIKLWVVGSGRIIMLSLRANAVKRGNPVKNKANTNHLPIKNPPNGGFFYFAKL